MWLLCRTVAQLECHHATGVCKSKTLMAPVCGSQRTRVCVVLRVGTGRDQKIISQDQMTVRALELPGLKPWDQSPELPREWGLPVV